MLMMLVLIGILKIGKENTQQLSTLPLLHAGTAAHRSQVLICKLATCMHAKTQTAITFELLGPHCSPRYQIALQDHDLTDLCMSVVSICKQTGAAADF
jgi:hypothetical protein